MVARDLWQRKLPLPSGCALGLGLVYCHKSPALCYNYYYILLYPCIRGGINPSSCNFLIKIYKTA